MSSQPFLSQNHAKYKNARLSLLSIVILSAVNLFSVLFLDVYFLFSSYFSQIVLAIGYAFYMETEMVLFLVFAIVAGLICILPYFLCWLFSKKKVGWMIGALILFSIDSLIFLVDFVAFLTAGDYTMILDLVIRIWAIVELIIGVKYGLKAKNEAPLAEPVVPVDGFSYTPADTFGSGLQRTITVVRKKSFVGCAIPVVCFVNGQEVCKVKNGETQSFQAGEEAFELGVMLSNELSSERLTVPAGTENESYQVQLKMGMTANNIEIKKI